MVWKNDFWVQNRNQFNKDFAHIQYSPWMVQLPKQHLPTRLLGISHKNYPLWRKNFSTTSLEIQQDPTHGLAVLQCFCSVSIIIPCFLANSFLYNLYHSQGMLITNNRIRRQNNCCQAVKVVLLSKTMNTITKNVRYITNNRVSAFKKDKKKNLDLSINESDIVLLVILLNRIVFTSWILASSFKNFLKVSSCSVLRLISVCGRKSLIASCKTRTSCLKYGVSHDVVSLGMSGLEEELDKASSSFLQLWSSSWIFEKALLRAASES